MNQMTRFGIILCLICLTATLVLAVTYKITKPKIDEQFRIEEEAALKAVMPEADSFDEKEADGIEYFEAVKDGRVAGYCIRATGQGYNGFIRLIIGIDPDGILKGVDVIEQQETPGLGARIDEIKYGEKDPWFLRQFKGKDGSKVAVKKDIDAVTGATISSKAVTDAVRDTVEKFLTKIKR